MNCLAPRTASTSGGPLIEPLTSMHSITVPPKRSRKLDRWGPGGICVSPGELNARRIQLAMPLPPYLGEPDEFGQPRRLCAVDHALDVGFEPELPSGPRLVSDNGKAAVDRDLHGDPYQ